MTSRQTSLAGFGFVVSFIAGLALVNNPDTDSSPARFHAYYLDSGNRTQLIAAAGLLSVSALAWVLFAGGLRERLASEGAGRVVTAASAAGAALIGVTATLLAVIPVAMTTSSAPVPGADIARFVPIAGYVALTFFAMPMAALAVAAVSADVLRARLLPRWLGWSGLVAAVLLLASFAFFPMFALILWVLAASVTLGRRPLHIPLPVAG
jgi:hypothetical protein